MEINTDGINIGDKFSTENKLLETLGYPKAGGNSRLALLKDAQRYIDYSKTGKLYRGKETGEIVITEKYVEPKSIQDGRTSIIVQHIKPLILIMDNKSIGNKKLFLEEFNIVDEKRWKKFKGNNKVEFYKYYLLNDFKGKVKTALKQIYKENELFNFSYDYMLINTEGEEWIFEIADRTKVEYIEAMKSNIKDRIIARHKLEHPTEKSKTWKNLAYRYTTTLYKLVNDECKDVFDMNKCVEVVTIDKSFESLLLNVEDNKKAIQQYYKIKMSDWIKKNVESDEKNIDIINFHNEIWADVK